MRVYLFRKIAYFVFIFAVFVPANVFGAVVVTDPFFVEQSYLEIIKAPQAWQTSVGSKEVVVALLDAGFDLDHEDLVGQYWVNENEVFGNNKDDDANGFEDDRQGWDFVEEDPNPEPNTIDPLNDLVISHGTLMAGIVGAVSDNNKGIAGINHHISIMPLRVLDENGSGTSSNVRRAIVYAVENGAQVINMSFTFNEPDDRLQDTIRWAVEEGVVFVAAVGNDGLNTDETPIYPACFDDRIGKNVIIGVASTDSNDRKAEFSNFGTRCTDLAAPGTNVFGAVYNDPNELFLSTSYGGPWEGTSISAPMVTGAAALLRAHYPSLTPSQVKNVLKLSVDPVAEKSVEARKQLGAGRLNIARALEMAAQFANAAGYGTHTHVPSSSDTLVVAQGRGSSPVVKRVDGEGNAVLSFMAYHPEFKGGVRLVMGDVTGDGAKEIITGAGAGGGPQVRVFDLSGNVISQFFAFETDDRSGIHVATGDIDNDGIEEIVVSKGVGGTGQVRIFNRAGQLQGAFYPFGRTTSPISVTLGNVDDDAEDEIIAAAITQEGPTVSLFDGNGRYLRAFNVNDGYHTQLFVASGDIDSDGKDEIVTSGGRWSSPSISIFEHSGDWATTFFAYDERFRSGVSVHVGDRDLDGRSEIYTAPLEGGGPHVRVFSSQANDIGGFFAFDKQLRHGVRVGI